ncbi:uncharacterized protein LOC100827723 [Brachypodium distachyon]|uniref:Uncharacterized protein n=1 Tax=Brachypodium distachyon TaxID=15368 RepID=I1IQE0_BRADI|nr:uncharacterized protein LOC100827723 [Brachypodium distachyon]KQJ90375.1 hypothetical protein BRADI_4g31140v3 [Brachypodium distachyon]|eukprot:XP_003578169.1 uncharacterized protein LOC100827723 [Brachypodium distachyon]
MELLDVVPAEAIALRLYSLTAAANTVVSLCAWLVAALAAAAVGLWRVRAAGSSHKPGGAVVRSTLVDNKKIASESFDGPRPARSEPASPISEPSSPSKVRFTAYYGGTGSDGGDDGVVEGVKKCAERDEDDFNGESETAVLRRTASMRMRSTIKAPLMAAPDWEEKEMALRKRGDLGWYRHLDMAVLDGSVVRLWTGEVTAAVQASPRERRRAGLELHLSV